MFLHNYYNSFFKIWYTFRTCHKDDTYLTDNYIRSVTESFKPMGKLRKLVPCRCTRKYVRRQSVPRGTYFLRNFLSQDSFCPGQNVMVINFKSVLQVA